MPNAVILISTAVAGYFDVRWRRIPNWLVVMTILYCFAWHGFMNGRTALLMSVGGLVVGIASLFPLFFLRGMGAGDVKYFGAIGAAVTYPNIFTVLVITLIVAGMMSVYWVYRWGKFRLVVSNITDVFDRLRRGKFAPHPVVDIHNGQTLLMPFTLATAIATWIVILSLPE